MIEENKSEKWLSLKISFFASIFLLFFMVGITIFSYVYFFLSEISDLNGELGSTIEVSSVEKTETALEDTSYAMQAVSSSSSIMADNAISFTIGDIDSTYERAYLDDYNVVNYYDEEEFKVSVRKDWESAINLIPVGGLFGTETTTTTTVESAVIPSQALTMSKIDEKQPMFELTRDSLVIYADGRVIRNGIFNFDSFDIDYLVGHSTGIFTQSIGDRYYLFKKTFTAENEIVFAREISYIKDFVMKMFYSGIVASVIFFVLVYILSHYFIRMFMKPINENNKKLKEYNHNLAHEIKTPLTILNMNLELLEGGENDKIIQSNKEEIEKIKNITDSLLFLSENFQLRENQNIEINKSIENYVESSLVKDHIEVVYSKNEIEVIASKNMFDRLLKNLIENAMKYSSDGKIKIEVNNKRILFSNNVDTCMSQTDIEKIFEAFYQLGYDRNEGGYGLGLTLVKRIVDIFKWKIEARCKGKVFEVEIWF